MSNEFTAGERLYMGHGTPEEERRHRERYTWVQQFIPSGGHVLDAACGSGYGSEMLACAGYTVTGLEIHPHALAYARAHHGHERTTFTHADLNHPLPLPDAAYDAVLSFETLEHVHAQDQLIREFRRVLKPHGVFIISTPDTDILTHEVGGENQFHVRELSRTEFGDLVGRYFSLDAWYGQVRYRRLSFIQRALKQLARLDVFGFKRWVTRTFHLQRTVHAVFNAEENTEIESIMPTDSLRHYHVIIVAHTV